MYPSVYKMTPVMAFMARTFPGIRLTISRQQNVQAADYCEHEKIYFPYDERFMDKKRFVAIACGAIENEEVKIATKVIGENDTVVEFGAGLGIAASRVNKMCSPKRHICFEANPLLKDYAKRLFQENKLDIQFETFGLGTGEELEFFAMKDYILSSFEMPEARSDFEKILVPTLSLDEVLTVHNPTAIFCDIEGAELSYFRSETLGNITKIIIELHPGIYGEDGVKAFKSEMERHGLVLKYNKSETYCFMR